MNVDNELADFDAAGSLAEERADWAWLDKVHCGDCLTLMGKMPAASIGLIVTSPPYNLRNSTGNGLKDGRGGKWPRGIDPRLPDLPDVYIQWQRHCLAALTPRRGDILGGSKLGYSKTGVRSSRVFRSGKLSSGTGINFNPGYFLPTYEVIYLIAQPAFRLRPKANAIGMFGTFPKRAGTLTPPPSRWNWLKGASKLPMSRPCSIPF